jgi:ElaB/YqjD/DUF883 family membrane-anchored ribosome-binding protein
MATSSNAARDAAKDAREAMRESGEAVSATAESIQDDLAAMRDEIAELTKKLSVILSKRGNSAWRHARSGVEDTVSDLGQRARETGEDFTDTLSDALQNRPYTVLALAAGLGFLFGATWRR